MKKVLIIAVILLVMFAPTKSVSVTDFSYEDLEAYGIAGAMVMVAPVQSPSPNPDVKPEPVAKCNCVNGKVSYDGGTSLTDCPCKNSSQNCGCKKTAEEPQEPENKPDTFPRTVLVTHPYDGDRPNCGPCIVVEKDIVAKLKDDRHKASGWDVGKEAFNDFQIIDLEDPDSQAEIDRLGLEFSSIPTFFLISETGTKKFVGSMSYKDYINWSKKK